MAGRAGGVPALTRRAILSSVRILPLAALCLLVTASCRPERDVSQAEGAFGALVDAYDDENAPALWNLCSPKTQALVTEAHGHLKALKKLISKEFPVGQRKDALHASGASLLDDAPNARALFGKVSRLDKLNFDGGVRYGAEIKESEVDAQAGKATFTTQSGQSWVLVADEKGAWRTTHLEALFERHLQTVQSNLKTAQDFLKKAKDHDLAVEARFKELTKGN